MKKTYPVKQPLDHDGKSYRPDVDSVEMEPKEAAPLIAAGVLGETLDSSTGEQSNSADAAFLENLQQQLDAEKEKNAPLREELAQALARAKQLEIDLAQNKKEEANHKRRATNALKEVDALKEENQKLLDEKQSLELEIAQLKEKAE